MLFGICSNLLKLPVNFGHIRFNLKKAQGLFYALVKYGFGKWLRKMIQYNEFDAKVFAFSLGNTKTPEK